MLKTSRLLFVSIFILLFIGLSDYGYGCHKKDGNGNPIQHGQTPCGGGGDDGGGGGVVKPKSVEIDVQWGEMGGLVVEAEPRHCVLVALKPSGGTGFYECQNEAGVVHYNLADLPKECTGDTEYYKVFDDIMVAPNFGYTYEWSGKCLESGCTIRIKNFFHGLEGVVKLGLSHFVKFRASLTAMFDGEEKNIFAEPRLLDVQRIRITFSDGKKTLAECIYEGFPDDLKVTFNSWPTT